MEAVLALAVLVQLVALVRQAVVEEQEVVVLPAPMEEEVVEAVEAEVVEVAPLVDPMVVVQPAAEAQHLDKVKVEVAPLVVEQPKVVVQLKELLVDKKTQQPHRVVNPKTHPKVEEVVGVENPNPNKKR